MLFLLRTSLVAFAILACLHHLAAAQPPKRPPNIIVLLADDMGYADVGFHGCKDIPTPHIDALAKSGVRCTNAYVSGPYCSPTRSGMLTGKYQNRYGHEFNPGANPEHGMPASETTLADRLKLAGYATGLIGKWHLGSSDKLHPQKRGFDEFFGFLGGAHAYHNPKGQGIEILRGTEKIVEKEYLTDALGREAVSFIDRHKAKPFFLYLAFNAVHTPMHADEARLKKFEHIKDAQRRPYAAMLSAMDDAVGRVTARLRELKLEEDTLVIFFSDNGGPTMQGTTINGSINTPLRGSKRQTLEGGIRVPFIFSWPGRLPKGKEYAHPIIQLDIAPTVLTAARVPVREEWSMDGVDLVPHLLGRPFAPPHQTLYWRFGTQMAIRHGDWKLVKYDRGSGDYELYNLKDDIGEAKDLAKTQPDKAKELLELWQKWNATLPKPFWGGGMMKP
jgi:arylsulfatase A-like enzyme